MSSDSLSGSTLETFQWKVHLPRTGLACQTGVLMNRADGLQTGSIRRKIINFLPKTFGAPILRASMEIRKATSRTISFKLGYVISFMIKLCNETL